MAYEYIAESGVIVPDTSTTLAEVQQEFKNALGQDLNLDPNTPQGQLITAEVEARNGVIRNNAKLANQLNPNLATGVFLGAVGALMGLENSSNVRSVCLNVAITGAPNSLLPAGSQAVNENGAVFESIDPLVLDGAGKGTVNFQAVEPGPIAAPPHTLTPRSAILGWAEADNPTAAVLGSEKMSDYQFRIYRQQALANQANNTVSATFSKLRRLPGIKSLSVRENDSSAAATIDGVAMEPNSIWVCVNDDGGVSADIAYALLDSKAPGCKWSQSTNGRGTPVSQNLIDPNSGQAYTVKFTRSVPMTVWTRIYVRNNGTMSDLATSVVNAILAYAAGETENDPGFIVAADVSPFDIAGSVVAQIPGTYVRLCEVSTNGVNYSTTAIDTGVWQRPVIPRGNILVVVEN